MQFTPRSWTFGQLVTHDDLVDLESRIATFADRRMLDITKPPYSCDTTGVADCAPALQQAIIDAAAGSIKTIYAPAGTYKIQNTSGNTWGLSWASGVRLVGDGMFGGTKFVLSGQDFRFISWGSQEGVTLGSPTQNIGFRDFEVDCSAVTTAGASTNKGFHMQYVKNARFTNLYVHDCGMTGIGVDHLLESVVIDGCYAKGNGRLNDGTQSSGNGIGIGTTSTSDEEPVRIVNCHAINNKRYGIFLESQLADVYSTASRGALIGGCYASGNQVGIADSGNKGTVIVGNTATANTKAGIACDGGTFSKGRAGSDVTITGNSVYGNGSGVTEPPTGVPGSGILLDYMPVYSAGSQSGSVPGRALIVGNTIRDNNGHGISILVDSVWAEELEIVANRISENQYSGIRAYYGKTAGEGAANTAGIRYGQINSNNIWSNGKAAVSGNKDGIRVGTLAQHFVIDNNRVGDWQGSKTQGFGFALSAVYTAGSIRNNDFRANLTGGWAVTTNISTTTAIGSNAGATDGTGTAFPAPVNETPGASPWTRAATSIPEILYIYGGTVSSVTVGATQVASATEVSVLLEPGDTPVITYSVAPTVRSRRRV